MTSSLFRKRGGSSSASDEKSTSRVYVKAGSGTLSKLLDSTRTTTESDSNNNSKSGAIHPTMIGLATIERERWPGPAQGMRLPDACRPMMERNAGGAWPLSER
jgi:hypothetical protein